MENTKVLSLLISNTEIKNTETECYNYINSGYKEDILQTMYEFESAYCNLRTPIYLTVIERDTNCIIKSKLVSTPTNKKMTKKEKALTSYIDLIKLFNNYSKGGVDYYTYHSFSLNPEFYNMKIDRMIKVLDIYEHMINKCWYDENAINDNNYKLLDDFCKYLIENPEEFMTKDLTKVRKHNLPLSNWSVVEPATMLKNKLSNCIYY